MFAMRFIRKLLGYPPVFYRKDGELTVDLSRAFVVAHNAGDHLATSRAAVEHKADVVEIDLISEGGRLWAAHPRRAWFLSRIGIPKLDPEAAWAQAAPAPVVKLDLKEDSPAFIDLVLRFVEGKEAKRLLIVTYSPRVIAAFAREAPWVIRSLSTKPAELARLKPDADLAAQIDGVSAAPSSFDAQTIAWVRERGLFTMTSVVNSFAAADRLLQAGVDGIITDNLALMQAIGGHGGLSALDRHG